MLKQGFGLSNIPQSTQGFLTEDGEASIETLTNLGEVEGGRGTNNSKVIIPIIFKKA